MEMGFDLMASMLMSLQDLHPICFPFALCIYIETDDSDNYDHHLIFMCLYSWATVASTQQ